jgi:hypothetical protein
MLKVPQGLRGRFHISGLRGAFTVGSRRDRGKNPCEADNWDRCPCGGNVVRNLIQPSGWVMPLGVQ